MPHLPGPTPDPKAVQAMRQLCDRSPVDVIKWYLEHGVDGAPVIVLVLNRQYDLATLAATWAMIRDRGDAALLEPLWKSEAVHLLVEDVRTVRPSVLPLAIPIDTVPDHRVVDVIFVAPVFFTQFLRDSLCVFHDRDEDLGMARRSPPEITCAACRAAGTFTDEEVASFERDDDGW